VQDAWNWYMNGEGGLGPWANKWLVGGAAANFGNTFGEYDSGCASALDVAVSGASLAGQMATFVIPGGEEAKGVEVAAEGGLDALKLLKGPCFAAGTPVQMANGSTKPIEQVKVGDSVETRDPGTGRTEAKPVTRTFTPTSDRLVSLKLSTGETITCTPEHPFYVPGVGFVAAGRLSIGSSVESRSGIAVAVGAITWQEETAGTTYHVYNFEVQDDHTYFVGKSDGGVWVHNNCTDEAARIIKSRGEGEVWNVNNNGRLLNVGGDSFFYHDVVRLGDDQIVDTMLFDDNPVGIGQWMEELDRRFGGDGTAYGYYNFEAGSGEPEIFEQLMGGL
jgi:hypothetical protein